MSNHRSANALIRGLIPAGQPCPFLNKCKFRMHNCPGVDGKLKMNSFTCAAARLHTLVAENREHELSIRRSAFEKDVAEIVQPLVNLVEEEVSE